MADQLIRQNKLRKPDDPDDTLDAGDVSGIEGSAVNQEEFWNGVLSQFKRILYGDLPGDWYDDPANLDGHVATLRQLVLGDHISIVPDGQVETIRENRQLLHCGNFTIDGELIVDGELCLS
jgi:hypothetical protein